MEITAKMVKELRDKTNSGMMDCKQALAETGCDLEKAVDWLRQKGLMTARKRAGRQAREGLVVALVSDDEKKGAMIELNSETDFVAKNESFQQMAQDLACQMLDAPCACTLELFLDQAFHKDAGIKVSEVIKNAVGTIGENMMLRRVISYEAAPGSIVHAYIHGAGRLGVLLELAVEKTGPEATELAHNLAMHIAAASPVAINSSEIPEALVAREKALYEAQAAEEAQKSTSKKAKPLDVQAKIIEGRLKKFFAEVTLLHQAYVKDDKKSIADVLNEASKTLGKVEVKRFARFQLGEELEGEATDSEE